ncbi:MAG: cyclodeaminase [Pseudomonadota bacterium]
MMRNVLLLTEKELRRLVPLDLAAVGAVERAFAALATGDVVMPPVLSMHLPAVTGEVDIKTAWVPGEDIFAVKVSPGFFNNPAKGLPSLNGLMIALSADTGLVEAILLDNGYLTDVRTAAAGALAASHLARQDAKVLAILGAGVQARLQARAAALVRPLDRAVLWARNPTKAKAAAADITAAGLPTTVVSSPSEAIAEADMVVTTTPATQPILPASALRAGLHITAMGSDQPGKAELEPRVLASASLYVADCLAQCELMGELAAATAEGIRPAGIAELGPIIAGQQAGRTDAHDITVADLTGTGAQDTAIAAFALAVARAAGVGSRVAV